jgi:guanylate kinase
LQNRGSETNEIIEKRLERFNKEMEYKDQFDTLLINDNIQVAINDFIKTINEITKGVN